VRRVLSRLLSPERVVRLRPPPRPDPVEVWLRAESRRLGRDLAQVGLALPADVVAGAVRRVALDRAP